MLNIYLKPEYILSIFGFDVTNTFITSITVTAILLILSLIFYKKRGKTKNIVLSGLKITVFELLKLVDSVTEDREMSKKILPLVASFFIFIVTANLLSLIPGFLGSFFVSTPAGKISLLRSPNSDLNTTLALAIFSVASIQFFSIRSLGIKGYIEKFLNFTNPIKFVLGFFEMISEVTKIVSFSFRLFGNIFAGEILLLVTAFLVPYIIPLPFMILEVFIGIIQAFIFAALTLSFIKVGASRRLSP